MGTTEILEAAEPRVQLGRTPLMVPRIGVGCMTWGTPRLFKRLHPATLAYGPSHGIEEERKAVEAAIAAGAAFFDTAASYSWGESERRLGELTRGREVMVATKFPSGILIPRAASLPRALEASLRRLQRRSIDLYQVHYPYPTLRIPEVMARMAEALEAGRIRAIGVSNFTATQMREAHEALARRGIPLASNQVQYSLLCRRPEVDGVLGACRELGVTLIAYSPLARGALTGRYGAGTRPSGFRPFMRGFNLRDRRAAAGVVAELARIGRDHGRNPDQVALRWLIQQEGVVAIPGAKNGWQAQRNAAVLSFRLTDREMEILDQITLGWRFV